MQRPPQSFSDVRVANVQFSFRLSAHERESVLPDVAGVGPQEVRQEVLWEVLANVQQQGLALGLRVVSFDRQLAHTVSVLTLDFCKDPLSTVKGGRVTWLEPGREMLAHHRLSLSATVGSGVVHAEQWLLVVHSFMLGHQPQEPLNFNLARGFPEHPDRLPQPSAEREEEGEGLAPVLRVRHSELLPPRVPAAVLAHPAVKRCFL